MEGTQEDEFAYWVLNREKGRKISSGKTTSLFEKSKGHRGARGKGSDQKNQGKQRTGSEEREERVARENARQLKLRAKRKETRNIALENRRRFFLTREKNDEKARS